VAYQITRRTAILEFDENAEALAGAQIRCKLDVPLGLFLQIQDALVGERLEEAFRTFAEEVIVGWEIEDENGAPVPVTYEGFKTLSFKMAVATVTNWVAGVNQAPLA